MVKPSKTKIESYHTQHAPFGAFASFTVGLVDAQGGFGQSLRGPAQQNVYVGFRRSDESTWRLLPFVHAPVTQEGAFTGDDTAVHTLTGYKFLTPADYERALGWAGDTWRADRSCFGFSLLSPFGPVPDPRTMDAATMRFHLAPLINGWIEYDNRQGTKPVELIFGIGDPQNTLRPLSDATPAMAGFASGTAYGYATKPSRHLSLRQAFDLLDPKFKDHRGLHMIAGETALVFTVPAGRRLRFPLVLGFFVGGNVTTGLESHYAYTRVFDNLEDVLAFGLAHHTRYAALARRRDRELERSQLDEDQRFLLAQATHSYLGSSQLMWSDGQPLWCVNEGEYRMMNTFDLTVDHLFFELDWFPWAVRDTLDLFVERYAYQDQCGLSFTHDMGVNNHFTPAGYSSYECANLTGCFSHMTMEQLLNWTLCATTYAARTGDLKWLRKRRSLLKACVRSLQERDHLDAAQRDGILSIDSNRCQKGSEITTYDSLDVSLGQARNNLYLAVKTLGAWILLERAFAALGAKNAAGDARASADRLARTLTTKFEADTCSFPAVFEQGNRSRILPAVEGLVYPLYLGYDDVLDPAGRFAELLDQLGQHLRQALRPGVCLDETTGAWKISNTSTNTWFSKIALAQHVVREVFPAVLSPEARRADRVHADFQRRPGCGEYAMCDQIRSDSGIACGSRYYPRGVTAYLWLNELP